jgi:hypothetical protein
MQFKVGEKVCFLNERRDGTITKILNSKMVSVAIEEGFEIPVLASELAPIIMPEYIQNKKENSFQQEQLVNSDETLPSDDELISSIFINDSGIYDKGVFIAYVPEKDSNLLSANLSVFLINNSSYDLLFCYYLKNDNKYTSADYDRLDAESKYLLQVIDRSQLEEWTDLKFQFLFFKKGSSIIKAPLEKDLKIKPIKFYREENYKFTQMLEQRCILSPITGNMPPEKEESFIIENIVLVPEKENEKLVKEETIIPVILKNEPFPEKHIIDRKVAEVNLHIDELVDSIEGMTNTEMLQFQVNYFIKMLESAIANKFFKIIFIHGVGNGKLKEEIRKTLNESYPFLKVYEASMAKYGVGATEVQIPVNTNNIQSKQK